MTPSVEQARQFANAGNLERAVGLCADILDATPDDPDALHLLGVLRCASGDPESAVSLIERSIELDGGSAKQFLNLGNAFKEQGKLDQATLALRRATELDPVFDDAWFNYGVVLEAQGKLPEAASQYKHAVKVNPGHADAWHNLSIVLRRQEELEEAIAAGQQAVQLNPHSPESIFNLGRCYEANGDPHNAIQSFERSIQQGARFPHVYKALGNALAGQGQYQQAIDALEYAARLGPAFIEALGDLAYALESKSQLDEARLAVDKGLAINPDDALLHLVASKLARRSNWLEEGIQQLENIDFGALKPNLAGAIRHEQGLLYDRLGDSERAFQCFADANRLQLEAPENQAEDADTFLEFVGAWRDDFTRDWVKSCKTFEVKPTGTPPVFIIGFPRSGTTLLDQIMDSHPNLKTVEEKPLIKDLMDDVNGLRNAMESFPDALARLDTKQIADLRKTYFRYAADYVELQPDEILVDKLPLNIVRLPLIWRIFPDAKFIFALRDPRDVCLSCFMQFFKMNAAMSNFTTLEQTAHLYNRVMGLWLRYREILPFNSHTVRYESMVADTRNEIQGLLDFLGLEWNDRLLRFYEHARSRSNIDTPSYHQVTEPIYKRAANRWKRYEAQLAPVEDKLAPFISAFGYSS